MRVAPPPMSTGTDVGSVFRSMEFSSSQHGERSSTNTALSARSGGIDEYIQVGLHLFQRWRMDVHHVSRFVVLHLNARAGFGGNTEMRHHVFGRGERRRQIVIAIQD